MKHAFRIGLATLVALLLFPLICSASPKKQTWNKTVAWTGQTQQETYRAGIGKNSKCEIIIYKDAMENPILFINAYDKDRQGRILIQMIKITRDKDGLAEKKEKRFRQECKGG